MMGVVSRVGVVLVIRCHGALVVWGQKKAVAFLGGRWFAG